MKPRKLSLIIIYGAAGAGKTTLASFLHDNLASTAHIGVDHVKRFISEFRTIESHDKVSRKVINAMVREYLKNGINVILEQGMKQIEIEALKEIADENMASFYVYRLDASRLILDERATKRHMELNKPLIPKEILDGLYEQYKENKYPNTAVFDSAVMNTEEIANKILEVLV
jgi:adenylate kinase family enzyme